MNRILSHEKYLFIVAHQDDEALYFGGLIDALTRIGREVNVMAVTRPMDGRPDTDTRENSFVRSCESVGAKPMRVPMVKDIGPNGHLKFGWETEMSAYFEGGLEITKATCVVTHNMSGEGTGNSTYPNGHAAHRAVSRGVLTALTKMNPASRPEVYCDCVGLGIHDFVIPVNMEQKKKMLDCYLPHWKPDAYPFWRESEKYAHMNPLTLEGLMTASYYLPSRPGDFKFWEDGIGIALQKKLNPECMMYKLVSDKIGNPYTSYDINYDVAYCQLFSIPSERPAKFVYTYISDYYPDWLYEWTNKVKPNLICFLQEIPADFKIFAERMGVKCVLSPWFLYEKKPYVEDKKNLGFCGGWIGRNYPMRRKIYDELVRNHPSVVLSCSDEYQKYPIMGAAYERTMAESKYFFSGGIFDRLVPPKYYEALGYGSCLVCPRMPMMDELGFVDGETYIALESPGEIGDILASDDWKSIAPAGQRMVFNRHMVDNRAMQIAAEYWEWRMQKSINKR